MSAHRPSWEPPTKIETELGTATIGKVNPSGAYRHFLCPLCATDIEIGESHLVAVPIIAPNLRRHIHSECLNTHISNSLTIKLHPNAQDPFDLYLLSLAERET